MDAEERGKERLSYSVNDIRYFEKKAEESCKNRSSEYVCGSNTADGYGLQNLYQQRGGERRLHMRFAKAVVSSYENNVILNNRCPAFVEMYTVRNGSDLDVFYKMTDYKNLSVYLKNRDLSDVVILELTARLLNLIRSCEDYLIFSEYVSFRIDRIFVSSEDQSLKLLYLPGYRTTKPLKMLIANFIDDAAALRSSGRGTTGTLADYRNQVLGNEYGIRGYINLAEDLIRLQHNSSEKTCEPSEKAKEGIYAAAAEKSSLEVHDPESEYFSQRIGGLIGVKEKIIHFMDNILS